MEKIIVHFVNKKDKNVYPEKISGMRYPELREIVNRNAKFLKFLTGTEETTFLSLDTNILTRFFEQGEIREEYGVVQYSSSMENTVILYKDGRIKVEGDNRFGQHEAEKFKDIVFVMAGPSCIYTVDKIGQVHAAGRLVYPRIRDWTRVKSMACGKTYVMALLENGKVLFAGKMEDRAAALEIKGWKDITEICAANECCVGLKKDGVLVFAGSRKEDLRGKITDWTDIVAVAVTDSYVAGLTKDGVIRVTCSGTRADIGVTSHHGEIFLTGNFHGNMELVKRICEEHVTRK